jgi:hypothetical protein
MLSTSKVAAEPNRHESIKSRPEIFANTPKKMHQKEVSQEFSPIPSPCKTKYRGKFRRSLSGPAVEYDPSEVCSQMTRLPYPLLVEGRKKSTRNMTKTGPFSLQFLRGFIVRKKVAAGKSDHPFCQLG